MESTSGGVVVERFGPKADDLAEIEGVLCDHGICSSAPVRPVLEDIRRQRSLHDGDPVIFTALGPGLTLYAALLHARRPGTPRSG